MDFIFDFFFEELIERKNKNHTKIKSRNESQKTKVREYKYTMPKYDFNSLSLFIDSDGRSLFYNE